MNLVARLSCIARQNGQSCAQYSFEGWTAHPLLTSAVQRNGYDCGIWVLAVIDSVLQGYHGTLCREADIPSLRRFILNALLQLPEQ